MGQTWGCLDGAPSCLPASSHHSGLKDPKCPPALRPSWNNRPPTSPRGEGICIASFHFPEPLFTQATEPLVPGEQLGPNTATNGLWDLGHVPMADLLSTCSSVVQPSGILTQSPKSKEGRAPITGLDLRTQRSQMILGGLGSVKSWTRTWISPKSPRGFLSPRVGRMT